MNIQQEKLPIISIIVPVYKVKEYIHRCIDSILNQTYKNLEIILVDDGSPDNCGQICDQYKDRDPRIVVIHKQNGGLSDARNTALNIFKGEYVTCIDSDDWVSKYYVENIYKAAKNSNADLAISWFENVIEGCQIKNIATSELQNFKSLNPKQCFKKLLYQDGIETSAWGKLYKREIIIDLMYPVGKLYEDIPVTTKAIERSKKIAVIENVDYYYFQRKNSIQYQNYSHEKMDAIYYMKQLKDFIHREYSDLDTAACCRYFSTACNILFQIKDVEEFKDDFICLWEIVKDNRIIVLKDSKARKKARIAALISYFGYSVLKKIYSETQVRG